MKSSLIIKVALTSLILIFAVSGISQVIEKYELIKNYLEVFYPSGAVEVVAMADEPGKERTSPLNRDLMIKNLECKTNDPTYLQGILVNRTNTPIKGKIRIKIYDRDTDVMWQRLEEVKVDGKNGAWFITHIGVGTCMKPNRVVLTFEK
jgi:hypothetical protein